MLDCTISLHLEDNCNMFCYELIDDTRLEHSAKSCYVSLGEQLGAFFIEN